MKHPGLGYFYLQRLNSLMAVGESRHQAKQKIREISAEQSWTISTGKIHSHGTRRTYQQQAMAFADWVKVTHHTSNPAVVDSNADIWVSQYLRELIEQGKSPYTLQTVRSALRLLFGPHVAASVTLPRRSREAITRSRASVEMDEHFQPENWPGPVLLAEATGLRRSELRDLRVRDTVLQPDGSIQVHVRNGKGGKARDVTVLAGYEQEVLALIEGRAPDERVFTHIPKNMDVQSYRRASAQERYQQLAPESPLPTTESKRIKPGDYDQTAAQEVSVALGHSRRRRSTVLNHYLR